MKLFIGAVFTDDRSLYGIEFMSAILILLALATGISSGEKGPKFENLPKFRAICG